MLLFPACENKAFSCQIRHLHKGEHVGRRFKAREAPCKQVEYKEHWDIRLLFHYSCRIGLGEKKARIASMKKLALVLLFFPQAEITFQEYSSQRLVLCHF